MKIENNLNFIEEMSLGVKESFGGLRSSGLKKNFPRILFQNEHYDCLFYSFNK